MDNEKQEDLQQLTRQLQQLQTYMQMLEEQTQEITRAISSIDELQIVKPGTEMYVPLTNGIMIKARAEATDKFLINVGNDIITEHTPAQAKQLLGEQQAELQRTQEQLVKQFSELYQHYIQLQIGRQEE